MGRQRPAPAQAAWQRDRLRPALVAALLPGSQVHREAGCFVLHDAL